MLIHFLCSLNEDLVDIVHLSPPESRLHFQDNVKLHNNRGITPGRFTRGEAAQAKWFKMARIHWKCKWLLGTLHSPLSRRAGKSDLQDKKRQTCVWTEGALVYHMSEFAHPFTRVMHSFHSFVELIVMACRLNPTFSGDRIPVWANITPPHTHTETNTQE